MTGLTRMQCGFTMVTALFLLITLAALGAFMLTFSNTQAINSAQDIQGSRAYWAARAGLEWAAATINPSDAARSACHSVTLTIGDISVNVSEAGCVGGVAPNYDEAGITKYLHRVISTASVGGAVGGLAYIERSLSATMEFCTPMASCE